VFPVTADDKLTPETKLLIEEYDNAIKEKIGNHRPDDEIEADFPNMPQIPDDLFEGDEDYEMDPVADTVPEADNYTPEQYDQYISAQVLLPRGDEFTRGTVKR
jgi:hypothetical protein